MAKNKPANVCTIQIQIMEGGHFRVGINDPKNSHWVWFNGSQASLITEVFRRLKLPSLPAVKAA